MSTLSDALDKYSHEFAEKVPSAVDRNSVLMCRAFNLMTLMMSSKVDGTLDKVLPFLIDLIEERYRPDLQDAYNIMLMELSRSHEITPEQMIRAYAGDMTQRHMDYLTATDVVTTILAIAHAEDHLSK